MIQLSAEKSVFPSRCSRAATTALAARGSPVGAVGSLAVLAYRP